MTKEQDKRQDNPRSAKLAYLIYELERKLAIAGRDDFISDILRYLKDHQEALQSPAPDEDLETIADWYCHIRELLKDIVPPKEYGKTFRHLPIHKVKYLVDQHNKPPPVVDVEALKKPYNMRSENQEYNEGYNQAIDDMQSQGHLTPKQDNAEALAAFEDYKSRVSIDCCNSNVSCNCQEELDNLEQTIKRVLGGEG